MAAATTTTTVFALTTAAVTASGAITTMGNYIGTCWNPATATTVSPTSGKTIIACYVYNILI